MYIKNNTESALCRETTQSGGGDGGVAQTFKYNSFLFLFVFFHLKRFYFYEYSVKKSHLKTRIKKSFLSLIPLSVSFCQWQKVCIYTPRAYMYIWQEWKMFYEYEIIHKKWGQILHLLLLPLFSPRRDELADFLIFAKMTPSICIYVKKERMCYLCCKTPLLCVLNRCLRSTSCAPPIYISREAVGCSTVKTIPTTISYKIKLKYFLRIYRFKSDQQLQVYQSNYQTQLDS